MNKKNHRVSIHPVLGNQKTAPSQTVEQDSISQLPYLRAEPGTRKEKLRSRQHRKQRRQQCRKPAHAHHTLYDLNMKVHTQSPATKKRRATHNLGHHMIGPDCRHCHTPQVTWLANHTLNNHMQTRNTETIPRR